MNYGGININNIIQSKLKLQMDVGFTNAIGEITCTQNDNESHLVELELVNGIEPYVVPDGYQLNVIAKKPDGTVVFKEITTTNGKYIFLIEGQLTTIIGTVEAMVEIVKGEYTLNSCKFRIKVKPNVLQTGDIVSEDDLSALNDYMTRAESAATASEKSAVSANLSSKQGASDALQVSTDRAQADTSAQAAASAVLSAANSANDAETSKTAAERSAK